MRGILHVISWVWRRLGDAYISLSLVLNWLAQLFPTEHPLHHTGFAKLHQLKALLSRTFDGAHLLLGIGENGYILRVALTEKRRELGNVLINSRTRGGKGLFAIAQILSWTESAIINDIKRELRPKTAGYRKKKGNVWTFDPTGYGDRFDPFLGKKRKTI